LLQITVQLAFEFRKQQQQQQQQQQVHRPNCGVTQSRALCFAFCQAPAGVCTMWL
jgi:hypothetical protein